MAPRPDKHHEACFAIGQLIRRARHIRGVTQADLAKQLGVCFQQIQKYEYGDNACTAVMLARIAQALDTPIQTLLPMSLQPKRLLDEART